MHRLPAWPQRLKLYPTRQSLEQATARLGGTQAIDSHTTFSGLWQALGSSVGGRVLPRIAARAVVRGLLSSSVGRLAGCAHDAWAVRTVHDALMELRLAGITARQLQSGPMSDELREVAELLQRLESTFAEHQWVDAADRQRQAVFEVAQGILPGWLRQVRHIDVLAGNELIGAPVDLLSAFAARGVEVTVHMPYDSGRVAAFAWPEAMLHALEGRAHSGIRLALDERIGGGPLAELRRVQFAHDDQRALGAPVEVRQVAAGAEHCLHVVAQVSRWLAAGVPTQRIAVVVADSAMAEPLQQAFASAGVPAHWRHGANLWETRPVQLLWTAWLLRSRGFLRDDLHDVWSDLGHALAGDSGFWSASKVARELTQGAGRSLPPERFAEALHGRLPDDVIQLLQADITRLAATAPPSGPLGTLVEGMAQLYHSLATPSRQPHPALEVATRQLEEAREGLAQALTQLRAAAVVGGPDFTAQEMADWLQVSCSETWLPPRHGAGGAVALLTPDQVVGTHFARVVVAGANMGVFPRPREADAVLTDAVRGEVNRRFGPRLLQYAPLQGRGGMPAQARDTWLWLEALAACDEELVVTVAAAAGEEALGQSELLDELLQRTGTKVRPAGPTYRDAGVVTPPCMLRAWAHHGEAPPEGLVQRDVARRLSRERSLRRGTLAPLQQAARSHIDASLRGSVHSTSRLDTLGQCAYKHFAQALLGLQGPDVASFGANPREEGSAAHAALHGVYLDIMQRGGLRQARLDPEAAMARAREVFDGHTAMILAEVAVHPLLRQATLDRAWEAVRVQLHTDLRGDGEVLALEYRFDDRDGPVPELRLDSPNGAASIRVRGSIDRIDRLHTALCTLDYKRTISPRSPERHFQLGIYAAVALRDLYPEAEELQAAWRGLRDGRAKVAEELCGKPTAVTEQLREHLWARLEPLAAGRIKPDPDSPSLCERCDFRALCRVPGVAAPEEAADAL